jgi:hypothetical protein
VPKGIKLFIHNRILTVITQCTISAFGDEPRRMFKIIHCFGKHCSCHPQGESVMVGCFWQSYIGQAVGGEFDMMALISGTEERAAIQQEMSTWLRKITT